MASAFQNIFQPPGTVKQQPLFKYGDQLAYSGDKVPGYMYHLAQAGHYTPESWGGQKPIGWQRVFDKPQQNGLQATGFGGDSGGMYPGNAPTPTKSYWQPIFAYQQPAPQGQQTQPQAQAPGVTQPAGPSAEQLAAQQAAANAAAAKAAETARLDALAKQAQGIISGLGKAIPGLTTKAGSGIVNARTQSQQAADIIAKILGSQAAGSGDYNAATANLLKTQLGSYGTALDTLEAQRKSELDAILEGAGKQVTSASGLMDWDQAGFEEAIKGITGAQDTLGTYEGTDIGELAKILTEMYGGVNERLTGLTTKRGEFEKQAADLYGKLKGETFRGLGELSPYEKQVEELKSSIDKWGASQASDEYQAIADMLGLNRTRLEGEASTIASNEAAAANRYREAQARAQAGNALSQLYSQYLGTSVPSNTVNLAALQSGNAQGGYGNYDTAALLRALGLA